MSERATASPLRGRYLVRNRGWNAALSLTDAVLERSSDRVQSSRKVHRVASSSASADISVTR